MSVVNSYHLLFTVIVPVPAIKIMGYIGLAQLLMDLEFYIKIQENAALARLPDFSVLIQRHLLVVPSTMCASTEPREYRL